jgi:hypothetical protein
MPLTIRIRLNLKPKAYAKTTSIPCPITVQKSCYQNFAGCRCVVAIDFPSNLHTNDLLLSIWYAESAAAFDPHKIARIAK